LKPGNKATLTKVLTCHVAPGKYTAHDLAKLGKSHGGKATLKTVEGESITVAGKNGKWTVTDAEGDVAHITITDVTQSNGEIFVIDKVLMPQFPASIGNSPGHLDDFVGAAFFCGLCGAIVRAGFFRANAHGPASATRPQALDRRAPPPAETSGRQQVHCRWRLHHHDRRRPQCAH
jgi:hypothetical protein